MHVGHLRSTFIGDCFTRVLRATGHTVIPQTTSATGTPVRHARGAVARREPDVSTLDLAGTEALYQRATPT